MYNELKRENARNRESDNNGGHIINNKLLRAVLTNSNDSESLLGSNN